MGRGGETEGGGRQVGTLNRSRGGREDKREKRGEKRRLREIERERKKGFEMARGKRESCNGQQQMMMMREQLISKLTPSLLALD